MDNKWYESRINENVRLMAMWFTQGKTDYFAYEMDHAITRMREWREDLIRSNEIDVAKHEPELQLDIPLDHPQ